MKFSNNEKKLAEFIFTYRDIEKKAGTNETTLEAKLKKYKFIMVDNVKDEKINEKVKELLKYLNKLEYSNYLEAWSIPIFPITGDMLNARNVPKGPLFAKILSNLKDSWKNEFNLSTSQETVNKMLEQLDKLILKN